VGLSESVSGLGLVDAASLAVWPVLWGGGQSRSGERRHPGPRGSQSGGCLRVRNVTIGDGSPHRWVIVDAPHVMVSRAGHAAERDQRRQHPTTAIWPVHLERRTAHGVDRRVPGAGGRRPNQKNLGICRLCSEQSVTSEDTLSEFATVMSIAIVSAL
jgi:hypothetical protein